MEARSEFNVLIVDDNKLDRDRMTRICKKLEEELGNKIQLYEATCVSEAFDKYLTFRSDFNLVLLDKNLERDNLPEENGLETIEEIYGTQPFARVILITGNEQECDQAEALRKKARFITKATSKHLITEEIRWALEESCEQKKIICSRTKGSTHAETKIIPGNSKSVHLLNQKVKYIAKSPEVVLLTGESGVGKTFLAEIIHNRSDIKGEFHTVDVGQISENLIDGELFGYEKGSFTGAVAPKSGLILAANGGTLFIDEIQNLSLEGQKKLLRVLETGKFRPIGSTKDVKVNVRFIFASNRDLLTLVNEKQFREDLYHRIAVITLDVPNLESRKEDIPELLEAMFPMVKARTGSDSEFKDIPTDWIQTQINHPPMGNIRGLRNKLTELLTLGYDKDPVSGERIYKNWRSKFSAFEGNGKIESSGILAKSDIDPSSESFCGLEGSIEKVQRELVLRALEITRTKTAAAELLGISHYQLLRLQKKLKLGVVGIKPERKEPLKQRNNRDVTDNKVFLKQRVADA